MKNVSSFKTLILTAAASLGLAVAALASDDPGRATPTLVDAGSRGLLGETYTHLGYSYVDTKNSNVDANSFDFSMNQGIRNGVDTLFEYNYTRSEPLLDGHATWQSLLAGGRAYTTLNSLKPYFEAGLGWAWASVPLFGSDNSFAWFGGVGMEWTVASDISVTPFIRFTDAINLGDADRWDFGVKGNYWLNARFAVSALVSLDDDQSWSLGTGVNYHF
jgi:hypothetical protein